VWVSNLYLDGEDNTPSFNAKRSTGVRVNSMWSKPEIGTEEIQMGVAKDREAKLQGLMSKKIKHIPPLEVRWFHSSWEVV
jgi:hypothetical protein